MTLVRWWKLLEEQTSTSHSIPTQFNTNLIANCDELSFGENCMLLKCRWDNMQTFILLCHHEFWFYYVIWFNFVAIWFGVQFKTIVRTHAVFIALLSWMKDGCNWFIIMCSGKLIFYNSVARRFHTKSIWMEESENRNTRVIFKDKAPRYSESSYKDRVTRF